ncbi:FAD-binding domain-containing protein [Dendrothele bispora CBS 962.96]|uniref:FAD-binding domain-containing protein n=1 Tax=Dendrothele bispora (strain CBS 962.96) TaxID=1314807 RepID=A0A4S8MRS9_DENBC|nr:FAD-binding domain-containing protein [Dendrothele bispora CBS 962.96]
MKSAFVVAEVLFLSAVATVRAQTPAVTACSLLQQALPDIIAFPGSQAFAEAIAHAEPTSSQNSTCSVTPTTAEQVSTILQIVGREDVRAPFAIKAGGHADNVGHSSTTGVQIALSGFTNVSYDADSNTATFGPGLTWDQIYAHLQEFNVSAVGGRVPGVGVGLLLGGGYSWLSDQYGLGIDNIVSLDLVLPNGTLVTVTEEAYPELMFGMRGGLNNFGVVTSFTVQAHPLSSVWGGIIQYAVLDDDPVAKALANFSLNNEDTKSQIATAYTIIEGQGLWQVIFFHDGPTVPDAFLPFLDIPSTSQNLSQGGTMLEFMGTVSVTGDVNEAGFWDVVPIVHYTEDIIANIKTEANRTFTQALADGRSVDAVLVGIEPFHGMFDHSTDSAYPHPADRPVTPCNPFVTFTNTDDFEYFQGALRNLSAAIQEFAISVNESRADDLHYPNYSLDGTPLELIFGDSLPRLRDLKAAVDPQNVMNLTGGWIV